MTDNPPQNDSIKPYAILVWEVMARFAYKAGIDLDTLDGLENGTVAIDEAIAQKICDALGEPLIPQQNWLSLQANYDRDLEKNRSRKKRTKP